MLIKNPLVICLVLYLLFVLFVNPRGEFPINDDWFYVRQVGEFDRGVFKINSMIDSSFILQGILGVIWSKFFGLNFISLRALTIIINALAVYGLYLILKYMNINKNMIFAALLVYTFNPLVIASSLSFMTDTYFLLFFIFSMYFYMRFFGEKAKKHLILASVFCGLSILVRQIGIIPHAVFFILYFTKNRREYKNLILSVLPVVLSAAILYLWPRGDGRHGLVIELSQVAERTKLILLSLVNLSFYLSPIVISAFSLRLNRFKFILFSAVIFFVSLLIFRLDVLPLGNVFYIEGLYIKSGFRSNFSIFDNVLFKYLMSVVISISLIKLFVSFRSAVTSELTYLIIVLGGFYSTLFIGSDVYDRYLLPVFVVAIVVLARLISAAGYNKFVFASVLLLIMFIGFVLQFEFFQINRLKWKQAKLITGRTGISSEIYLNDTYTKYVTSFKEKNFSDLSVKIPAGIEYKCFVMSYTSDNDTLVEKLIKNPKIFEYKKKDGLPNIKKNLDKLMYNEQYFSLLYNFVGKSAFVGSWCLDGDPGGIQTRDLQDENLMS